MRGRGRRGGRAVRKGENRGRGICCYLLINNHSSSHLQSAIVIATGVANEALTISGATEAATIHTTNPQEAKFRESVVYYLIPATPDFQQTLGQRIWKKIPSKKLLKSEASNKSPTAPTSVLN